MYLSTVHISNVRSLRDVKLELPEGSEAGWHVILGDNGAGKSSLVRSIALALMGPKEAATLRQRWDDWLTRGETQGFVDLGGSHQAAWDREFKDDRFGLRVALSSSPGDVEEAPEPPTGGPRIAPDGGPWSRATEYGWFSASFGPFRRFSGGGKEWDTVFSSQPRAASHLSAFGEDVALTEALRWLQQLFVFELEKRRSSGFLDRLRDFVNESDLLPHGTRMTRVQSDAVFFEDGAGVEISVDQLSDGFRSVLSMTFELLRQMCLYFGEERLFEDGAVAPPGVVLIDEVDAHLHPTWQTRIGDWFQKAFPNVQFIVTTHSPLVCRAAEHDTIWRLRAPGEDDAGTRVDRIEGEQKDRLVYGSLHQALESAGFQLPGIARSEKGQQKMQRLASLNRKRRKSKLEPREESERDELIALFPETDPGQQ